MRKIKFRAWDKEHKLMRDGDELKGLTLDALDASDFKLEQFTGLKDMNGKDIYEGDILKLSYDEPESYIYKDEFDCNPRVIPPKTVNDTVQVVNNTGAFGVTHHGALFTTLQDVDKGRQSIEIIGNIHETPELLGVEK